MPPSRRSFRRRLAAVAVGIGMLLAAEAVLRMAGIGGPGQRPDPFAGFAPGDPLFEAAVDGDGTPVWRLRPDRVGPFRPVELPREKGPDTRRVFCLGGSSTYGFPYAAGESFCAALARGLQRSRPGARLEVVNAGGMSYGSRRVLNVMRELVRYQPDAFVAYMGHNEYVERRFFAPFLDEPAWRRRLRGVLARVRLYVTLRRALAPLTRPAPESGDMYGTGPVRDDSRRQQRDPREDELAAVQFRFVLQEMQAVARRAGAPLLLLTPASNLRGWSPEGSTWSADLDPDDRRLRDAAYASARRLSRSGDPAAALEAVERVLSLDPEPAAAHYLRGRLLLDLERPGAREALVQARDRDAVPIRITSPLERALAAARGGEGGDLDMAAAFDAASPHGITGDELVLDYCHPTPAGHRLIAARVLPLLSAALWPGEEPVEASPEELAPPGGGQAAAGSAFGAAWVGQMMLRQGRAREAEEMFRRAIALDAGLATAHEGLGRVLAGQGRHREAVASLQEAVRLDPQLPNGWNNLGQALRAAGRPEQALQAYRRALDTPVGRGVVHRNRSATLLELGRLEEALAAARAAVEATPEDALAWVQLGAVQAARQEPAAAAEAFQRALGLDPTAPGAREGLAALADAPPTTP